MEIPEFKCARTLKCPEHKTQFARPKSDDYKLFSKFHYWEVNEMKTDALVWAKDKSGNRHLCPVDEIKDANTVGESEL